MLTLLSFLSALAILIAVHEYGHYRMARACGVKVLRFSIGFGRKVLSWQPKGSDTEFVVCLLPLGGYVRMLDEHEAPVASSEKHLAFNNQPLRSRALIVLAGPMANLLLAVVLYAVVNWSGVEQAAPVLSSPVPASLAEAAGLQGGERITQLVDASGESQGVLSFDELRWMLTQAALEGSDVTLIWQRADGRENRALLPLSTLQASEPDEQMYRRLGVVVPYTAPVLSSLVGNGAAQAAGLKVGDLVLRVDGQAVSDSRALRELIRQAVVDKQAVAMDWEVERDGALQFIRVVPEVHLDGDRAIGRIGAYIGAPVEMTTVSYGLWDGLVRGVQRTWDMSVLSLRMMGRVLTGQASVKNISGPLTIADYAGKSASVGVMAYVTFLALISVSLGVLNLLPVPVLDGGHLMYYLWEALTGRPVAQVWLDRFQRVGLALLAMMMVTAVFNDLTRLLG
jgi:regulator of sigma E protease